MPLHNPWSVLPYTRPILNHLVMKFFWLEASSAGSFRSNLLLVLGLEERDLLYRSCKQGRRAMSEHSRTKYNKQRSLQPPPLLLLISPQIYNDNISFRLPHTAKFDDQLFETSESDNKKDLVNLELIKLRFQG